MTEPTTAAAPVLVLLDHHDGSLRTPVLELLTVARRLGAVHGVWLGDAAVPTTLGEHGVGVVHQVALDGPEMVVTTAAALAQVAEGTGAGTVLLSSTFENKEVAARLAHALGAGLVVDAADVEVGPDGGVVTVQQAFAATWTLRSRVTAARAVVALKPNAVPVVLADVPTSPEIVDHAAVEAGTGGVRLVERTARAASDRPDLGEAQVVVVGGRGTEGDFSPVEDLADALGGAVGATRVATDEGWIGHEAQIGQTGVTISPRLYVGAGVSGAVHHRGGMQSSSTIVAVNSDPEAPIFEIADFGIVGDLFTVLPQAAAEVRRLRG